MYGNVQVKEERRRLSLYKSRAHVQESVINQKIERDVQVQKNFGAEIYPSELVHHLNKSNGHAVRMYELRLSI